MCHAVLSQYEADHHHRAIYAILGSTLLELIRRNLVCAPADDYKFEAYSMVVMNESTAQTAGDPHSAQLICLTRLCEKSEKYASGRALRRLPLVAHGRFIRSLEPCSLADMLDAMHKTAADQDV